MFGMAGIETVFCNVVLHIWRCRYQAFRNPSHWPVASHPLGSYFSACSTVPVSWCRSTALLLPHQSSQPKVCRCSENFYEIDPNSTRAISIVRAYGSDISSISSSLSRSSFIKPCCTIRCFPLICLTTSIAMFLAKNTTHVVSMPDFASRTSFGPR